MKFPELTRVHKNQILMIQRQILSTQVNITNLDRRLKELGPVMDELLAKICEELDVDPETCTFDLDNLKLDEKIK